MGPSGNGLNRRKGLKYYCNFSRVCPQGIPESGCLHVVTVAQCRRELSQAGRSHRRYPGGDRPSERQQTNPQQDLAAASVDADQPVLLVVLLLLLQVLVFHEGLVHLVKGVESVENKAKYSLLIAY